MEFRILGPLEVRGPGGTARLGGSRPSALMAALLLHANRVVSVPHLINAIWGDDLPATATAALQTYISRLRRALEAVEPAAGERITTHPIGYQLRTRPGEFDLHEFQAKVDASRAALASGRPERAAETLAAGVALWRGPALVGVIGPLASLHAASLNEAHVAALEERIAIDLVLNRHGDLVGELHSLVGEHPLRERLRAQLMLALYRSGRQAEALAAYSDTRARLLSELGVEPGQEIRLLHSQILAGENAANAAPVVAVGRSLLARRVDPAHSSAPTPAELPPDVASFTGRRREVDRLDTLLGRVGPGASALVAISGAAGVGKTALAVHWGHRMRERFPDGQLYLNLRGYAQEPPVEPAEAVGRLLRSAGVPSDQVPRDPAEAGLLLRSRMVGKRALILLDNVRGADQVRPLLPGSPDCMVLITSRSRLSDLADLDGAEPLTLELLSPAEALTLVTRILGPERVEAEASAAAELVLLCGCLPLALRIAAAHLAADRHRGIADMVAHLQENRLATLAIEDDRTAAVGAALELSYRALDGEAQRLFRRLGLVPGADLDPAAAAALLPAPHEHAERVLDRLAAAHLLGQHAPGRYRLHDLLRVYARELAGSEENDSDREAAVRRLLDYYLHSAERAERHLNPAARRVGLEPAHPEVIPQSFVDYSSALAWCDTERANLVAAVRCAADDGHHGHAWRLPAVLWCFFNLRKHLEYWELTHQLGLAAAKRAGDRAGEALTLNNLGPQRYYLGRLDEALECLNQAVLIRRQLGDRWGEAESLSNAGNVCRQLRRYDQAVELWTRALDLRRQVGDRHGEAVTLDNRGMAYRELGRYEEAVACHRQALAIHRETGDRPKEGMALNNLAGTYRHFRRYAEVIDHCTQALPILREMGDRWDAAETLTHLGHALHGTGQTEPARQRWREALDIFADLDDPRGAEICADLQRRLDGEHD